MRHLLFMLIIVVLSVVESKADKKHNVVKPMLSIGKVWTIAETNGSGVIPISTYSLKVWKDSIINREKYYIIVSNHGKEEWDTITYYDMYREESGKVFRESIFYDFTMRVGDSLDYSEDNKIVVDSIVEKEMINGDIRRIYYIGYIFREKFDFSFLWIEGIGSTIGIDWPIIPYGTVGVNQFLLCVHENNELIYMNPEYNTCEISTAIERYGVNDKLIDLVPKGSGVFQLNLRDGTAGNLSVFDITGKQVVREKRIYSSTQVIIPIAGLHLYHFINNNNQVQTGKVLVR